MQSNNIGKNKSLRKISYIFGFLFLALSSTVLAAPLYTPGQTLDPACSPGAVDCTVSVNLLGASATAGYFTASTTSNNTFPNLIFTNGTSTNATTTSFAISGIVSSLLKTNALGSVVAATLTSAELLSIVTDETGTGSVVFGTSPTITGLLSLSNASSSLFSALDTIYIGRTATTTLQGSTTGTSTIQGFINVTGTNSTSTFSGGLAATYLNLTGSSATSTASNGFNLSSGCFAVNGVCVGANAVTSVTAADTTLTISPTTGAVIAGLNLSNANSWTALQTFARASSTLFSNTGTSYFGGTATSTFNSAGVLTLISALAAGSGGTGISSPSAAGILLGSYAGGSWQQLATSSLGLAISDTTGTLTVARGGTGQTSFGQGWLHSDGTTLTSSTSPTVNYLIATSTTATSTFAGGFAVETNGLVYDYSSNNVGIGTAGPATRLDITNSATSSAVITLRDVIGNISLELRAGTSTINNTFIGVDSGRVNTFGYQNTSLGYGSLYSNTTGGENTTLGYSSLYSNTTGGYNAVLGNQALYSNISGANNTAIGHTSLFGNTTGSQNTALGYSSFASNTIGASSTAIGSYSGYSNTTGNYNTFLGFNAGYTDGTTATLGNLTNAIAIGYNSQVRASNSLILGGLESNAVNVGIGTTTPFAKLSIQDTYGSQTPFFSIATTTAALGTATSSIFTILANGNVGIGTSTPMSMLAVNGTITTNNINATSTTATSTFAGGFAVETSGLVYDYSSNNVGINTTSPGYKLDVVGFINTDQYSGYKQAGNTILYASSTKGSTFVGANAGALVGSAVSNTAVGYDALASMASVGENTAIGRSALRLSTAGSNTAVGAWALSSNLSGSSNNAFGNSALSNNTTGSSNIAIGDSALGLNTTGTSSIAIGYDAGYSNTTGYKNIFIGYSAGKSGTPSYLSNATAIGFNAQVTASSSFILGGTGVDGVNVGIGTTTSYAKLSIQDTYGSQTPLFNIASTTAALGTATSSVFNVFANGRVGIGTDSPTYQLQISTDSAAKPSTNTWVIASDARIKKDITNFTDGLAVLEKIRPVNYFYNGLGGQGYDDTALHIGIIAQEVEEVAPYMVETRKGTIDGKEVPDFKNYQGHALPFIVINAIKELAMKVSALEERITQLISSGVSSGIANIKDFVVETLTAKKVVTESIEMKDSVTGEIYCLKIANGEWDKVRGECGEVSTTATPVESAPAPELAPSSEPTSTTVVEEAPSATEPVSEPVAQISEPAPSVSEPAPEPAVEPTPVPAVSETVATETQ